MPRWLAPPARNQSFAAQVRRAEHDQQATLALHAQRSYLTAAALALEQGRNIKITPTYAGWQNESWGFYEQLGEFRYVVDWKSHMISRVRLRAARRMPDADEPVIQESGVPVELVNGLNTEVGNQSHLMEGLTVHLNVPGECWLVGERVSEEQSWRVCSSEEIRTKGKSFEVIDEISTPQNILWRLLAEDSMVVRVWRPNKRLYYQADSPARSALSTMRELELVSRHMQSQYLSRLASAGVFVMPSEVQLPVRPEFEDEPDPFTREFIETAAEAIRTPGTAAGVIPIPMRVPSEYVDKFNHIDFTLKLDEKISEKRMAVIQRLATQLDAPPEILLGSGDVNHWSAWAIGEDAIKAHILPTVEVICWALTVGYLHPMMKAANEDPADWVVWYDASEITIRPDRSAAATEAYDRLELTGEAYRRETGFDEDDAPSDDELERLVLKALARQSATGFQALDEILGRAIVRQSQQPPGQPLPDEQTPPENAPPEMPDEVPPGDDTSKMRARMLEQMRKPHYVELSPLDSDWTIRHPMTCIDHLFSCPYSSAAWVHGIPIQPGRRGVYEIMLGDNGFIRIGTQVTNERDGYIETPKSKLASVRMSTAS